MATKIEDIIEEIFNYLESCKYMPMSQNRIIVGKEELYEKLDELRSRTPDEIKRYQRIISQRDQILAKAEETARQIEEEAKAKAQQLINENEIMKQAYAQANELVQNATEEAERITKDAEEKAETLKNGILDYSNDVMSEMESILSVSLVQCQETSEKLLGVLRESLDKVHADQEQLRQENDPGDGDGEGDEMFDFPDGTFFEGIE